MKYIAVRKKVYKKKKKKEKNEDEYVSSLSVVRSEYVEINEWWIRVCGHVIVFSIFMCMWNDECVKK